jgi:hypothetical protein
VTGPSRGGGQVDHRSVSTIGGAVLAGGGDGGHGILPSGAEAVARSVSNPDDRAWTLGWVAGAMATADDLDRAEAVAGSITDSKDRARVLNRLAAAAARGAVAGGRDDRG